MGRRRRRPLALAYLQGAVRNGCLGRATAGCWAAPAPLSVSAAGPRLCRRALVGTAHLLEKGEKGEGKERENREEIREKGEGEGSRDKGRCWLLVG